MGRRTRGAALALVAGAVLGGALSSCGGDDGPGPAPGPEPFFPPDFASTFVEVRDCRQSVDHFPNVRVYVNPSSAAAYADSTNPLPEGTVCVKPMYGDDSCTVAIRYETMRKGPPGTAPSTGDWEWQVVDTSGAVTESGQIPRCVSCHTTCRGPRDYTCTDP
jgi:hypothetical protein